jgi:pimeloyl-ACP methyl ester carboxylesterase
LRYTLIMRRTFLILTVLALATTAQPAELVPRDVNVYGQYIHYTETGNGPPIVLLHGLWGGLNEWEPIIEPLAENHRVIVIDFIGFHNSDKPDVHYHNALLAQFLAGFIEALELRDVILMGHAMGANTATYTAFHHPERIAGLILVDGAGYRNPDRDLSQPLSEDMIRFRRVATGSSLATTRGLLERRVYNPNDVTDEWVENAFRMWVNSAAAIGDMLLEGGDLTEEEMRQIKLPTLVVWGAEDKVFSPGNAERLSNDIEGSVVRIIDRAGHLPQVEATEAFLDAVLPFLINTAPTRHEDIDPL